MQKPVTQRDPGRTAAQRLEGKIAIIMGAGQGPGEGLGNGRATAIRFAREGARVLAADRDLASAEETAAMVTKEGGECNDNLQSTLCLGLFDASQNYCSFIGCDKDADCGKNAKCQKDPKGAACQPDVCK